MFNIQPHVFGVFCLKGFLDEKAAEHVLIFACLYIPNVVIEKFSVIQLKVAAKFSLR